MLEFDSVGFNQILSAEQQCAVHTVPLPLRFTGGGHSFDRDRREAVLGIQQSERVANRPQLMKCIACVRPTCALEVGLRTLGFQNQFPIIGECPTVPSWTPGWTSRGPSRHAHRSQSDPIETSWRLSLYEMCCAGNVAIEDFAALPILLLRGQAIRVCWAKSVSVK